MNLPSLRLHACWWMLAALLLAAAVYAPGLCGDWFFDDYPNIINNPDVQPERLDLAALSAAALSSPASDIGRPLASLSFVANHALGGLDPRGWKLANLAIHLANGWLVFLLTLALCDAAAKRGRPVERATATALLVAGGWLLLPINLTAVLYVVQRMESLSNLFVLLGLLGYVRARLRMQERSDGGASAAIACLVFATGLGVLAKESAIVLPLFAVLVEALLFGLRDHACKRDRRIMIAFVLLLALPAVLGLAVLAPWLLDESTWATRDFTLATRLLSEARIVPAYAAWALLPLPQWLSFYHDHFVVSGGLLQPWTTLAGVLALAAIGLLAWLARDRRPLLSLGLAFFLAGHVLTGTILPLELIYEHRNYFPSYGLLLAVVPLLASALPAPAQPRHALLALLFLWWTALTAWTAWSWGDPLRLAADLAVRAPDSARAQFGHGQALLKASQYAPGSPMLVEGFSVLERASAMPESSILPEQTLILTQALMDEPVPARWWDRLVAKLGERAPNSEDVDALGALTRCARDGRCTFPPERMQAAFAAAGSHARVNPKLLRIHADWAWNLQNDRELGERLTDQAVQAKPGDVDGRIALARMNIVLGNRAKARAQVEALEQLNVGGRLDAAIAELEGLLR